MAPPLIAFRTLENPTILDMPSGRSQRIAEWARHWNAGLTRYLRRRLPGRIDAEDLAQEVYVRLLRVEQIEHIKEPQAYLYRVASNVAQEWRMRAVRVRGPLGSDRGERPAVIRGMWFTYPLARMAMPRLRLRKGFAGT